MQKITKAKTEPILNQSLLKTISWSNMKKFCFLVSLLVLIFSPFIFAAGLIANAPEIPGYRSPVLIPNMPIVAVHCRDVFESNKPVFIYTANIIKNPVAISEISGGNLEIIPETYINSNHKEAALLTDKTVYQHWQSAATAETYKYIEIQWPVDIV